MLFRKILNSIVILATLLFVQHSQALTYTVPSGPLPPGCSFDGTVVECSGDLVFGNNYVITVSAPTSMIIYGDFSFGNGLEVNVNGYAQDLSLTVTGDLNPGNNAIINANLTVLGNVNIANNTDMSGSLVVSGDLSLGNNSTINGNIDVEGTFSTGENVTVNGGITAEDIILGQNNEINGDLEAENVTISGNNTIVDGNVNATGTVINDGEITGYVNAPAIEGDGTVEGPTCDLNYNQGGCYGGGSAPLHYLIEHSGNALTCQNEPVLIRACASADCSSTTAITGAVTVSASGPVASSANASFNDSSTTEASLALTVPGVYVLSISASDLAASDPYQCSSISGCNIEAADTAFAWSGIGTQLAGVPFNAEIQIIRTDDQTGACVAAAEQLSAVDMAIECVDPGNCSAAGSLLSAQNTATSELPAHTAVPVDFQGSSSATLNFNYEDAGRIRLHARAQTESGANIAGSSNAFVVRPATIAMDISNAVSYEPGIFARAGDPLMVILVARSASNLTTPNFGNESVPQTLALSSAAQTVTPAGGADGSVSTPEPFTRIGPGAFGSSDVRYNEAGTVIFTAQLVSGNYLGTGPLSTQSPALGRFLPWSFHLNFATLTPACVNDWPGFTYLDQPFVIDAELMARNRSGGILQNYPDLASGAAIQMLAADIDTETGTHNALSDRFSPALLSPLWSNGVGVITAGELTLQRLSDNAPDGPFPNVQLALYMDPGAAEGLYVPMNNADFHDSDDLCEQNGSCFAVTAGDPASWYYGRMFIPDTYGPETAAVPVRLDAHIWNAERFIRHNADNCSSSDPALLSILENPANLAITPEGSTDTFQSGSSAPGSLHFSAPEEPGEILFDYDAPAWFRFGEQNEGKPQARATFGHYGGHDRILSWQEIYN